MRLLRSHSDYSRADKTLETPTQLNNPSIIDAQFVQDSNMLAMAEMIKTGTTCFADMRFPQQALVDSVRQMGLRCQISFMVVITPLLMPKTQRNISIKACSLR